MSLGRVITEALTRFADAQQGQSRLAGPIATFDSTVRPNTCITVETGINLETGKFGWFVRIRTAGNLTHEERGFLSETGARERFEKVVESHEKGEPL